MKFPRPHLPRRKVEPRPPGSTTGVLRGARWLALAAVAALVAAASLVSFAESYRALYEWAHDHGLSAHWAAVWPLQIDVFIAVGELALFVALIDGWQRRSRILPWVVTVAGLAVSVAGNVGHVGWAAPVADKATAAVPPLAAAAALAVGLGVLKRVVEHRPADARAGQVSPGLPALVPPADPVPARVPLPSHRQVREQYQCGPATAKKIRSAMAATVKAASNGHVPT